MDTKSSIVDKIFSFFTNHLVACFTAVIGGIAPGILTIGIFDKNLFIQMDVVKLLLLSSSICLPSFAMIFVAIIAVLEKGKTVYDVGKNYLALALALNAVVFDFALFAKIINRSLSLTKYCLIIVGMTVFSIIVSFFIAKDEKKKEIETKKKEMKSEELANER